MVSKSKCMIKLVWLLRRAKRGRYKDCRSIARWEGVVEAQQEHALSSIETRTKLLTSFRRVVTRISRGRSLVKRRNLTVAQAWKQAHAIEE